MKIVYVCEWNPLTGGAFTVVSNLIDSLTRTEIETDIHIVSFGEKTETIKEKNYQVHLIKKTDFPTSNYWYLPKILKNKIIEINPDLIHLHLAYPPYSFVTQLPMSVIITAHSIMTTPVKGAYSKKIYLSPGFVLNPFFEKKAFKEASIVIAISNWMKKEIEKNIGYHQKVVHIPNGINYKKYFDTTRTETVKHPSIIYLGRLLKVKGVDILIKALAIAKKSIPNIHLYIAGDGCQKKNSKLLVLS